MNIPLQSDAPFHCPPDVVLDLPPPLSVNKFRRIDWDGHKKVKAWQKLANGYLAMAKARPSRIRKFEIIIVLDDATVNCDADNAVKMIIDYLRLVEMIEDDSKRHMRRVVIEWGYAPLGCRVTIKPLSIQSIGEVLRRSEQRAAI